MVWALLPEYIACEKLLTLQAGPRRLPKPVGLPRALLLEEWRDSRNKCVKTETIQRGFLHSPFYVAEIQVRLKFSFPETTFSCSAWQCFWFR